MSAPSLPVTGDVLLRNLAVPAVLAEGFPGLASDPATGLARLDLALKDGRFQPADALAGGDFDTVDMGGRIVLPGFTDLHVHLDKAFTAHRTESASHGLASAVELAMGDAANRTLDDLIARMERGVIAAEANGTFALRTHLDSFDAPDDSPAWAAFAEVAARWKGRVELQAVALMALARVEQDDFDDRCAQIARRGGILGAFIDRGTATPDRLARLVGGAARHGLDLDLHVDETLDPTANGLELLAETVLAQGFPGRVVAGHCVALGQKPEAERDALIAKVAEAGIHVVALPTTNGYLQDRTPGRTPLLRGIAPVQELAEAGVTVSFASDNVRDAFYPYGNFDMLDVQRQALFLAQLEAAPARWIAAATSAPAEAMGLDTGRIRAGAPADAVIFEARDWADLFSGSGPARTVLRRGRPLGAAGALSKEREQV